MKKSYKVILGLFLVLLSTHNFAQIKTQKSNIVISEAELISLSNTLKKYKNTNSLTINNSTKRELDSLNQRINQLTELLSLQKKSTLSSKELVPIVVTALDSNKDVNVEDNINSPKESVLSKAVNEYSNKEKSTNYENENKTLELNRLQQEVAELKYLVSKVLENQVKNSILSGETKDVRTVIHPAPVFLEKTISKTDTVYVLKENDGSKTLDSLNMKLLTVKSNQIKDQQLLIDSLKNQLVMKNISVPRKIEKVKDISTLKLYFFNNEFSLNEINKTILDEMFSNVYGVNDKLNFSIKGFASNSGNTSYNKALSTKRSQAVLNYLVIKGVEGSAIKSESFGVDYTEKNESKARRVEIEITKTL
ncbi:OmpA family protein [Lutibacter citreus]|uniref:OmpA family protein n=1 Tax=Lutibacter citreus TaxID=2138210 RepID=UPI000DBE5360|nr:OmpA family protein [Lutibacter citreus]